MKHNSVPLFGTGWVRASIRSMRSRLFRSLFSRFVPPVYHDLFRSPFGVPARFVLFSIAPIDPVALILSAIVRLFRVNPVNTVNTIIKGMTVFTVAGHPLTAIPFWQLN